MALLSLLMHSAVLVSALAPSAPTSLHATTGYGEVALSWTAPDDEEPEVTDYIVEYSVSGNDDWTVFDDGLSTETTTTVTELQGDAVYDFRISAVNEDGTGSPSDSATATVMNPAPHAPVSLAALAGNGQVSLTWSPPDWTGSSVVIDYIVQYSLMGENDWTTFADGESDDTAALVTGLTNGTAYDFRVLAVNSQEVGPPSTLQTATPRTIPDAPTGVSATRGSGQASVSFTPPAFDGGATITSYTVTSSPGNHTATGNGSPITVTGLANGTAYTFIVTATNAAGESVASSASSSVTPATVPDAPTSVTGTAGDGEVSVAFNTPVSDGGSEITEYTVTSNPGGITQTGGSSPILITDLDNGTSYSFTVTATNAIGESVSSGASADITPRTAPGAPTAVSAIRGNGEATVSFTPPASDGGAAITQYTVTSNPGSHTATGANSPIVVTGLTNGVSYTFTVVATNVAGDGNSSAASGSVTPATAPGVPGSLSATGGVREATVSWAAPVDGGEAITDYVIEYSIADADSWTTFADGTSIDTSATVTGLTNGTAYDFRVAAVNEVGQGGFTSGTASTHGIPGVPTAASGVAGNGQVSVSFTAPASDGGSEITEYTVTSNPGGITATGSGSPIVVTGLTNGIAYTFVVSATNVIGTSEVSGASSSVTPRTIPGVVTNLSTAPGNGQVGLSWTAPVSDGGAAVIDYAIQYSLTGEDNWTTFADGTSIDTSATVTGLTNGTAYDFRVAAVNSAGVGTHSNTDTNTPRTVPGVATNVSAARGNGEATVSFTVPESDGGAAIAVYTVTSTPGNHTATGGDSPITVTGLTNGTAYTFTVIATNVAGDGAMSAASNSVTPATIPGAPTSVAGTPGNAQAAVSFATPASNGGSEIAEYTVVSTPGNHTATGSTSPIAVTGLTNGTAYTFTVIATNDVGDSAPSAASSSVTSRTVPDTPYDVNATTGNGQASVSFTAPDFNGGSTITNYTVTSNPGNHTATGTSSPITVTGLTNGVAYTFTVTATNAAGTGAASAASNSTTPAAVPDAPTGLTLLPGDSQVELSWTEPNGNGGEITDYIVQYRLATDSTWIAVDDGTEIATSAVVTGLTNGSLYDFRVAAVSTVGTGAYSTVMSSTPHTTPGTPFDLVASAGNGQVGLSWTAPVSDGGAAITDYVIQYSLAGEDSWTTFSDANSSATTAMVTDLTNGTAYDFRVAAINATGTGSYSPSVSAVPSTVPDAPTSVSAVAGNGQATVSFTAPPADGGSVITSYTVTSSPGNITAIGSESPITVTGLTNGVDYTFTVRAANAIGSSGASVASGSVTPATTPSLPTVLTATADVSQIALSWTAPEHTGGMPITDYVIEYKIATDSTWTTFADGVSTATSATVTGLTNGAVYHFRIAAINDIGVGAYSIIASGAPRTVPGIPTSLQVSAGSKQVSLSWTAPAFNGGAAITDYVVQYSPAGQNNWTTFADGVSTAASATVTGLTNQTTYDFRVAALNIAGTGTASDAVSATPESVPVSISNIIASPTSSGVTVTWSTDSESDSKVEYGPDTSYGNVTDVSDTGGVADHSVTITGLQSCVTYSFRVTSQSVEDSSSATSSNQTFTTNCVGNASVVSQQVAAVPSASGGTVSLAAGSGGMTVDLPSGYTTGDTVVQIKKFGSVPIVITGLPAAGVAGVAGYAYDITAVGEDGTLVTDFEEPITVTLRYADSDVVDLDESTLRLYHWHGGEWDELTDCAHDKDENTITCTTTTFSLFALFGKQLAQVEGTKTQSTTSSTSSNKPVSSGSTTSEPAEEVPLDSADEDSQTAQTGMQRSDGNTSEQSAENLIIWWIVGVVALVIVSIVGIKWARRRQQWQ